MQTKPDLPGDVTLANSFKFTLIQLGGGPHVPNCAVFIAMLRRQRELPSHS